MKRAKNIIRKKYLLSIALGLFGLSAMAQSASWNFNYLIAMPFGDTKEWVDATSFRGFSIDGNSFIEDNVSIGGSMGWQGFYEQRDNVTISRDNFDLYGTQFRYINAFNVTFDAHYHMGQPYGIRPYVGGGLGPSYVSQRGDLGLYSLVRENWHFGFRADVGVYIPFNNSDYGLNLGAKYHYILKSNDSINYEYLAFNIGLLHMM